MVVYLFFTTNLLVNYMDSIKAWWYILEDKDY